MTIIFLILGPGLIYKQNKDAPYILTKYVEKLKKKKTFFMGLEFLPDKELVAIDIMVTMALIVWSLASEHWGYLYFLYNEPNIMPSIVLENLLNFLHVNTLSF